MLSSRMAILSLDRRAVYFGAGRPAVALAEAGRHNLVCVFARVCARAVAKSTLNIFKSDEQGSMPGAM
jgi:hypothetical protein